MKYVFVVDVNLAGAAEMALLIQLIELDLAYFLFKSPSN